MRLLLSKFELDQIQRSRRKLMQVDASVWPNETQVPNLCRLASPLGQGFTVYELNSTSAFLISKSRHCNRVHVLFTLPTRDVKSFTNSNRVTHAIKCERFAIFLNFFKQVIADLHHHSTAWRS